MLGPLSGLSGAVPGFLLSGALEGTLVGILIGLLIGSGMIFFEVSWGVGLIGRRVRDAPFLAVVLFKSSAWLIIIVVGLAVPLLVLTDNGVVNLWDPGFAISVAISFAIALTFNFFAQLNALMGRGVLIRLVAGRYHRPREEERFFMFVDLASSTQIAEQLGNLRFHGFLRRFIVDITAPIVRHKGEIHRYVGDEVIVTWSLRAGVRGAACIRCYFDMVRSLENSRDRYQRDFGLTPSFRAGLHFGPVVTGEIGASKHEIVFLGDTMNTTARIEQACREHEEPFLVSGAVIDSVDLPGDYAARSLGPVELRGVARPVKLYAIHKS